MMARPAPTALQAMSIPSTTSSGCESMMARSLNVPGSLSSALQTTNFSGPCAPSTKLHLSPAGNPAPPMPRRPLSFNTSMTLSGFLLRIRVRRTPYASFLR